MPSGVSVGIMDSIPELLDAVAGYLDAGYVRIKLKIEPGWDVEPVRAVRERFGDDVLLQVDANTAYTLGDAPLLARLDPFDLLLIEQPLPEDDILGHAELARRIRTPICLDESIVSARSAADAIALGACQIVNIKPGRVGGYLEARRIHDVCPAHGVPVWCGGMLETGLGRAANVALAALPGFTLPGDMSASDRFYRTDITEPFVLRDGGLRVPSGPGLGVAPIPELLAEMTTGQRGRHALTRWILCCAAWASGRTVNRSMLTCSGSDATQETHSAMSSGESGSGTPGVHRVRALLITGEAVEGELLGVHHAGGDLGDPYRLTEELEPHRAGDGPLGRLGAAVAGAALVRSMWSWSTLSRA